MKSFIPLLFIFFLSCVRSDSNDQTMQVQGFVPIYASRQVVNTIATEAARSTVRPEKYMLMVIIFSRSSKMKAFI